MHKRKQIIIVATYTDRGVESITLHRKQLPRIIYELARMWLFNGPNQLGIRKVAFTVADYESCDAK